MTNVFVFKYALSYRLSAAMETASRNRTGRRPGSSASATSMSEAVRDLMDAPMVGVPTFKTLFRVSTQSGYRAAQEGRFGALKIGGQYRFPSAPLREALGLSKVLTSTDQTVQAA